MTKSGTQKIHSGGKWRVICLYAAIFTYFLSAYMFTPFLSLYVKELGGSYAEFAAVLSVTGLVLSLIQSYIGYLSDRIGARFLVAGGGLISAVGLLLIGITYDKFWICVLYLLMNIGMGILVPSVFTLISYQKTAKGNSFIPVYRSIQGAGVILGPIIGGWVMGISYRSNVFWGGAVMLVSIGLFALFFQGKEKQAGQSFEGHGRVKKAQRKGQEAGETETELRGAGKEPGEMEEELREDESKAEGKTVTFRQALGEVLHNKQFLVIMLLFTCIELSYDLIQMSLPIVGAELNFGTDIIGTALSAYFIMFTLFQIPINNGLKKLSVRKALMLMGGLALIPCILLLLNLPSYAMIMIMGGVGLTIGSLFTFCSVLAAEESPEDKKGSFMGIFNTIMPFTDVVSPIMVAFLIGVNLKAPYVAAVVLVAVFIVLAGVKKA